MVVPTRLGMVMTVRKPMTQSLGGFQGFSDLPKVKGPILEAYFVGKKSLK